MARRICDDYSKFYCRTPYDSYCLYFFLNVVFLLTPQSLLATDILDQKISVSMVQKDLLSIFDHIEKKYNVIIRHEWTLPSDEQSVVVQDVEMIEFLTIILNNAGVKNCAILADNQNRVISLNYIEAFSTKGTLPPEMAPTKLQPTSVAEHNTPSLTPMNGTVAPAPPFPKTIPPLPGRETPIPVPELEAQNNAAKFPESFTLPDRETPISVSEMEAQNNAARLPESFTLPGQATPISVSEMEARGKNIKYPDSFSMPDSTTPIFPSMVEERSKVTLMPESITLPPSAPSKP